METLQSWALCITFSAVGALLVHALVPKGATEKAIRVMISLFLLSAILSPFLSGKGITLTLPDQGTGDLEAQVEAAQEKINLFISPILPYKKESGKYKKNSIFYQKK